MTKKNTGNFNVDHLLDGLFPQDNLVDLFNKRLQELDLLPTHALEILDMEYRALHGILYGKSKLVDASNFIKIANFLKLPKDRVIALYFNAAYNNYPKDKVEFINENFDLATLKRAGFIKDLTDYVEIEEKIVNHFGLRSIFDYKLPTLDIAFSAGIIPPKNIYSRGFWLNSAIDAFAHIANPYNYERELLIDYFPKIRWQSTNVDEGLISVIGNLYRLGITIFYQSSFPALHLKGATLSINDKPCIVLTDYKGFYATLWHTLIHELSHVLFDFDQIIKSGYHISNEELVDLSVVEKEREADNFAREYMFSLEKILAIRPHLSNPKQVERFAAQNDVHPSIIYTYDAFDRGKKDEKLWIKAKKKNPLFKNLLEKIENPWMDSKSTSEHIEHLKQSNIYQ